MMLSAIDSNDGATVGASSPRPRRVCMARVYGAPVVPRKPHSGETSVIVPNRRDETRGARQAA
jgi:hypothetical protein